MANTLKKSKPHKFSAGDTVKVVASKKGEWCRVGAIHKVRVCKHDRGAPVYVVDNYHEGVWIKECNLELVERDRQKGVEWIRNRGKKRESPVDGSVLIEARFRSGDIETDYDWPRWSHDGGDRDIMSYRVISQPQAEEVEVKDSTIGTISYKISVDQIAGPLAWRDTIIHCQAIIEDCEREIERNTQQLAAEGFELIAPITDVRAVDMNDWRNWKDGDKIRMTADDWCDLSRGEIYEIIDKGRDYITILDDVDYRRKLDVDGETMFDDGRLVDFEFVSSP